MTNIPAPTRTKLSQRGGRCLRAVSSACILRPLVVGIVTVLTHDKIKVPHLEAKLDRLFQHAVLMNTALSDSGRKVGSGNRTSNDAPAQMPSNRSKLAAYLNDTRVAGAGSLDTSRFSAVESGGKSFSDIIHCELLKAFGIPWPCLSYYDPDDLKRDASMTSFERMLCLREGGIDLVHAKRNHSDFPLEELYVTDISDLSIKYAYRGDIIAKCSTQPIVGDKEPHLSLAIGEAGFSLVNLSVEWPIGATVLIERSEEMIRATPNLIEVLDRGSQDTSRWRVRKEQQVGKTPFIDMNVPVCRLTVTAIEPGADVVIRTTAPLPTLKLAPDRAVR